MLIKMDKKAKKKQTWSTIFMHATYRDQRCKLDAYALIFTM